ncbi:NADPH-dependent FMN reductase [Clostridium sp. DL-VIII]|uniref:flavodoxin family protein n=1 Tax=Clostridium sp. DL-VIII TaxID=641107 RepID=UPI00023AFC4A|nr:flavodoxin family protein [Clostridium sp. DL-VIII]EHI99524.1 NADPH-dependent FMN reductase [Clostridium sp. DL-VIII]
MSKIVAFIGSPRKKGISTQLLNKVIEGAKSEGAEIIVYDLNDTGIRGCQACDYCRKENVCIIKDKLQSMYSAIESADGIIISSPIYMSYFSAQAKTWFDRLRPMFGHDFKPRYPGKKIIAVFAQAADNEDLCSELFESLKMRSKLFGWDLIDNILACSTEAPGYSIPQELMDRAFTGGRKLVE